MRKSNLSIFFILAFFAIGSEVMQAKSLENVIAGEHRSEQNKSRDIYRNPKETLEFFADKMIYINENILEKHDYFKEAPYNTPVRKLNETKANRELNVKWKFDDEV